VTRIAALQFKAHKAQPEQSLSALCQQIEQAAQAGAQLVVCPEMATSGYLFADPAAIASRCEPAAGGSFPTLSALARRHGLYLVCGYPEHVSAAAQSADAASGASAREPAPAARRFNSARVIGPDGSLLYNYRKRLLYSADTTWAADGDTPYPILDTPFGRLCVGICMDLNDDRFVEFLRVQSATSPVILAFCTNWLDEGSDVLPYWCYRLRGFRGVFVAANTFGDESEPNHPPTRFCGRSTILTMDYEDPVARADGGSQDGSSGDGSSADDSDWTAGLRITLHARAKRTGAAILLVDL